MVGACGGPGRWFSFHFSLLVVLSGLGCTSKELDRDSTASTADSALPDAGADSGLPDAELPDANKDDAPGWDAPAGWDCYPVASSPMACGTMGIGSPAELALTPREDVNLELLAVSVSCGISAPQPLYDRVVRDVAAIRATQPAVAKVHYWSPDNGRTLVLYVEEETYTAMKAGQFPAWDCLNNHYGPTTVSYQYFESGKVYMVRVTLKGIYALEPIAKEYASLLKPGEQASGNGYVGDGPTICLRVGPDRWSYVFDIAGGDCPSGCTTHDLWLFTTDPSGAVTQGGRWNSETDSSPVPQWSDICPRWQ